jgi:D-3-phosphoglycerate dehydrogenase
MPKPKLLVIGDHFILPSLMRGKLGDLANRFEIVEASTPFPLEPFRDIAEVREASGSEEQMIEALRGVSICIAHHAPLTERVMEQTSDLRLFIVCRGGPVNVNLPAATERGITVAYTPARNAAATAEHTVAMMLAALRGIPAADAAIRRGEWKGDYTWETAGFELETATVGLIGYGAIGRIVARIVRGFGATVLAYDPFAQIHAGEGVEQVSLDEMLGRSNIVSLHARETNETRGIVGKQQLGQLGKGSVVVNCARGSLLDYDALAEALASGHLFAAAADVFPTEPLPADSPLLRLANFIMTPHIAGGTRQAAEKAAAIAAEELKLYLEGKPLRYCANPRVQGTA